MVELETYQMTKDQLAMLGLPAPVPGKLYGIEGEMWVFQSPADSHARETPGVQLGVIGACNEGRFNIFSPHPALPGMIEIADRRLQELERARASGTGAQSHGIGQLSGTVGWSDGRTVCLGPDATPPSDEPLTDVSELTLFRRLKPFELKTVTQWLNDDGRWRWGFGGEWQPAATLICARSPKVDAEVCQHGTNAQILRDLHAALFPDGQERPDVDLVAQAQALRADHEAICARIRVLTGHGDVDSGLSELEVALPKRKLDGRTVIDALGLSPGADVADVVGAIDALKGLGAATSKAVALAYLMTWCHDLAQTAVGSISADLASATTEAHAVLAGAMESASIEDTRQACDLVAKVIAASAHAGGHGIARPFSFKHPGARAEDELNKARAMVTEAAGENVSPGPVTHGSRPGSTSPACGAKGGAMTGGVPNCLHCRSTLGFVPRDVPRCDAPAPPPAAMKALEAKLWKWRKVDEGWWLECDGWTAAYVRDSPDSRRGLGSGEAPPDDARAAALEAVNAPGSGWGHVVVGEPINLVGNPMNRILESLQAAQPERGWLLEQRYGCAPRLRAADAAVPLTVEMDNGAFSIWLDDSLGIEVSSAGDVPKAVDDLLADFMESGAE